MRIPDRVWFSSVQFSRSVRLFATPWIAARQASLSITNTRSSLRLMSIESVMPSSHLILDCPLLLLPSIPPIIRVSSNESTLHMRWPKYWWFSFSIIPSKEIPGLISLRMDWLDLLEVQGTLKCLLQHHSSKASILQRSAFFTVNSMDNLMLMRYQFLSKMIYFNSIPISIAADLFVEFVKLILKFRWKCKGTRTIKIILKKK